MPQIASIRAAIDASIDFYVGRHRIPEIIRVAAPAYLKSGLRNSPDIHPCGRHIENTALALSRERVRRAQIAIEMIGRYCRKANRTPWGPKAK
jgi:hypothetical protein